MASLTSTASQQDLLLADQVAEFYGNPSGFVLFAFPWGEPGALEKHRGPDKWQREFLEEVGRQVRDRKFNGSDPVSPIKFATASGHGIGKSTLCAWLTAWILSTRPHCRGAITANTYQQLQSKTWAAIRYWMSLSITSSWFSIGASRIYNLRFPSSWFCSAATCKEENSESFAGQHAGDSTSFFIFDEASAIPERIWQVAAGGLTDGEPHFYCFGNPTRREGAFYSACFGADRHNWISRSIDSRDCAFTNKQLIEEWRGQYGEDSDFFRVRVRGLPPSASDLQFIDSQRIYDAQRRKPGTFPDEPLLLGFDLARGGSDNCCFYFRCGLDARSIPPIHLSGQESRDSMVVVSKLADVLDRTWGGKQVSMCFVDETGLGGAILDRIKQLGFTNTTGIQFGGTSPDFHYANMRSYMWSKLRDWLERGAIPSDPQLEIDLTSPGLHHDRQDRVVLESKEQLKARGIDSPDAADALALTFAQPVRPHRRQPQCTRSRGLGPGAKSASNARNQ